MNQPTSKTAAPSTRPSRSLRRDHGAVAATQHDPAPAIPAELAADLTLYGDETKIVVLPPGRPLPPHGYETARLDLGGGWSLAFLALVPADATESEVRAEIRMRGASHHTAIPHGTFDPSRRGYGPPAVDR